MKEYLDKVYFDDSISLPGSRGTGIQLGSHSVGPVTGTHEAAYGWRDITSEVSIRGVTATDPTFTQVDSSDFRFYRFAENKLVWFNYHVPHDLYVPPSGNASVFFHVHWFVDGSASPASGHVTWQWTYAYAKGFNQEAFDFSLANSPLTTANVVTATQATGVPYQHMVCETSEVEIPGLTEPDGIICVQLKRIANTTSPLDNLSSNPFMITADLHYRSTNVGTPGKAPNFYSAAY